MLLLRYKKTFQSLEPKHRYYKLIFKVNMDGALATVLGYDQKVRFASMAK